ncbi:hypothetical protein NW752_008533 [Fusarium irregulare]|uniref:Uncharacterized protein n=1 Tax=Fusarium irregulare TaxID=2494466 RepID=A0A9W8PX17_9HYPO|nr:hypothetical protein NW752_008533 [Fusarium irregulare]KAJ4020462.1 hypothetical protein NW766_001949 [Fusarium irregulare]
MSKSFDPPPTIETETITQKRVLEEMGNLVHQLYDPEICQHPEVYQEALRPQIAKLVMDDHILKSTKKPSNPKLQSSPLPRFDPRFNCHEAIARLSIDQAYFRIQDSSHPDPFRERNSLTDTQHDVAVHRAARSICPEEPHPVEEQDYICNNLDISSRATHQSTKCQILPSDDIFPANTTSEEYCHVPNLRLHFHSLHHFDHDPNFRRRFLKRKMNRMAIDADEHHLPSDQFPMQAATLKLICPKHWRPIEMLHGPSYRTSSYPGGVQPECWVAIALRRDLLPTQLRHSRPSNGLCAAIRSSLVDI